MKNSKTISNVVTVAMVAMVSGIMGYAAVGATIMATTAYGAIMGGVIGIVIGSILDHYYETDIYSTIFGAVGAVAGTIGSAIYGKKKQDEAQQDGDDSLAEASFIKGAGCLAGTVVKHASDLGGCLGSNFADCFKAFEGFPEIITCMGEQQENA
jgi:hypothetical protein